MTRAAFRFESSYELLILDVAGWEVPHIRSMRAPFPLDGPGCPRWRSIAAMRVGHAS